MLEEALSKLSPNLRGSVITPASGEYESARKVYNAMIDRLPDGLTEIYFHPAMDIGGTPPAPSSQRETEVLTSARVREAIASRRIVLTTLGEVARAQ